MPPGDEYRKKAADLTARSLQEPDLVQRLDLANLAHAYLRLAEQAERNAETDIVYETPQHDQPNIQQQQQEQEQQQQQSPRKDDES
jgi:hypothetical protein